MDQIAVNPHRFVDYSEVEEKQRTLDAHFRLVLAILFWEDTAVSGLA